MRVNQPSWLLCFASTLVHGGSRTNSGIGRVSALSTMPPLTSTSTIAQHIPLAQKAMSYLDSSPDPFHAVQTSIDLLQEAGYERLDDSAPYKGQLQRGGKYYMTRNGSTLVAFCVGNNYIPGEGGFKIIGGHTDSPNLKIKPRSKRHASGCIQLAVECYGGGLWHTWFDRDLGLSGRVMIREEEGGRIESKLVKVDRCLVRIPTLAIHLQTAKEREAFKVNKEDHLVPILATMAKKALETGTVEGGSVNGESSSSSSEKPEEIEDGWTEYQEPILLDILASELNIEKKQIVDFELNLFDCQKASLGGAYSEFLHSARLDNLASCFMAVEGLVQYSSPEDALVDDSDISMVALFDHEEVGSASTTGAGSPIIGESVDRIYAAFAKQESADLYAATISKSFVLSVDQAHAIHPNYSAKHEKAHAPKMNDGMVIKRNSNQRYATNSVTGLIVREIARKAGLGPVQEFVVRNDCGCGSTIGPVISANTGIRAIDMGCPQLSMHSIRESMGTCDFTNGLNMFLAFFKHFREVDSSIVGSG